ncbi:glycosyltransferase [Cetobacterium somerae]|uniref:glycosyltransferase family 2 protein n=1 Tax=Cetobacterium somerae TaxID=188913 RepID=UPI00225B43BA|nr:glycosyltransferase [Cetobacterium somerae]MCX3067004.1 glycosyltransferase [Cetobacterium somerae]
MEETNSKNKNILLSICCITYNHENFIKDTLEGFLLQEVNFKYEIIIHDDASTDKTAEIIKKYENQYSDLIISIYQQENQYSQGKPFLENVFEKAQGKYLAICEGDDFWIDKNKLQKQIDFLENNPEYSATYHNVYVVDENKKELKKEQNEHPFYEKHIVQKSDVEEISLAGQTASLVCINFWKKLDERLKKEFILSKANGDTKLSLVLVELGKIYYFSEIMSCYRKIYSGDSWTSRAKFKNMNYFYYYSRVELEKMMKNMFNKKYYLNKKKYLCGAFVATIKRPNVNNLKIFFKIFNKIENKVEGLIYILKHITNWLMKKIIKSKNEPNYRWPLLKKIIPLEEVINAK